MRYLASAIVVFVTVSSSSALPLDPSQLQQLFQQLQLQFPSSGGVTAQIPLPQFFQSLFTASGRSDPEPLIEENLNENITTILKACYNNGYYYSRPTTTNPVHNALAIGGLGLGAGVLGSLLLGGVLGRSNMEDILANLPSSPVTGRTLDASQLPIPPVLQNIVQQVQSGNSVDTSSLPPFLTNFVNQLQTGTLPPLLQNLVSLIQSSISQSATGRSEDVSADTEAAEELLKACYSSNYNSGYGYPYSSSYYYPGSYSGGYPTGTGYTGGYTTGTGTGYPNIAIGTYPYNPYSTIYG